MRHHVRIRLLHLNADGYYDEKGTTPHKWYALCECGWGRMSWQWVATDRPGGALPMALEHLKEIA